jgi:2-oxoglutarate ferredoxin oxidoreductase subunit alpha
MVIGAAAAGRRVMTSSSSPGIALKSEGLSYLAGCDLPAVVVNVARGGPGLGGIQPSQADYFMATRGGGHGDFHMMVIAPAGLQEMIDSVRSAFELADKYRVTAMILADGILGQMMEPASLPEPTDPADLPPKLWAATGTGGARGKNIINSLYLTPEELERLNFERFAKYAVIAENETRYESYKTEDADIVLVAFGATARVCKNAVAAARAKGVKVGLFRPITLWPFPKKPLRALADSARAFISVEMSMGQLIEDVELATRCLRPVLLCNRAGGMVPTPENILAKIDEAARGM